MKHDVKIEHIESICPKDPDLHLALRGLPGHSLSLELGNLRPGFQCLKFVGKKTLFQTGFGFGM